MVRIENLTNRLVSLRLNNGRTLHLQPHMVLTDIVEAQVAHNSKVDKLSERQVIALSETKSKGSEDTSRARGKRLARSSESSGTGRITKGE